MSLDIAFKQMMLTEIYETNITHNLAEMARKAGVYEALWYPEENGFIKAGQLISVLEPALKDLEARPEYYVQFNAENGWGTHDGFVYWLKNLLTACREHQEAIISVSR